MIYGELPKKLGEFSVDCREMMFYQYLPIKMKGELHLAVEHRLSCFNDIMVRCVIDFKKEFGQDSFEDHYIYMTAKKMYQVPGSSFNRKGYHSDGFLTDDINYIWSDRCPTIFNNSDFRLTADDKLSMKEMEAQAHDSNIVTYKAGSLLRLNQFNIHKVNEPRELLVRTFCKISFSKDKYDLLGNSVNHLLDYKWDMREREKERNIPQKIQ